MTSISLTQGNQERDKTKPSNKVDVPKSVTTIQGTPTFEWHLIRCGSKIGHSKGIMFLKEIRLLIIQGLIVNMIGGDLYDHLKKMRIFTFIINKILI